MDDVKPPEPKSVDERFFRYWDGTREVLGDPLAIGRRLERAAPDYADLLQTVAARPPESMAGLLDATATGEDLDRQKDEAGAKLLAAARVAFGVEDATLKDGVAVGLGESETAQLLIAFVFWMNRAAEEARPFSISRQRDAPCPPDSVPASSWASGSIGT